MFCLGVAAVWLGLVSLVAMIAISPPAHSLAISRPRTVVGNSTLAATAATTTSTTVPATATSVATGAARGSVPVADTSGITGVAALPPSSAPGDTTGVTDTEIHIGIHAPE